MKNFNLATIEDLRHEVPKLSKTDAQKIVKDREEHGNYKSVLEVHSLGIPSEILKDLYLHFSINTPPQEE